MTDTWQVDNDIVNGLNDSSIAYFTLPEVCSIGGNTYLISSSTNRVFYGFRLDGTSWVSESSIVDGMPSGVSALAATVFNLGGINYAIIGDNNGSWHGREWGGSSWINQPSIVSGLPALGPPWNNTPTAFYMNNELCLIYRAVGDGISHLKGFKWSGSAWTEDTSVVNGLSLPTNAFFRAAVFIYGTKLKLIFGNWQAPGDAGGVKWKGYSREGSTWVTDNDIITGLTAQNYILGGDTLTKESNIYFFAGDYHTNLPNFYGFKTPIPSSIINILGRSSSRSTGASVSGGIACGRGKKR